MLEASAAQAVGSAVQPAAQAGKGIYQFLKHKYDYVKNLDKNFSMLQTEKERLCAKENDVNGVIERNEVLMETTHVCTGWLDEVNTIKGEVGKMERRYNNVRKCLCGLCPFSRLLKLSKDIANKTIEVVNLTNRMDLGNVVIERRPAKVEHKHVKRIDDVPSLYENVEKLLKYLKDKSIRRIGIWGAAGVGKTTIMENLNDEVEKAGLFDIVIWVTVSKDGSMSKVQQMLVERLKLRVEDLNTDHQIATIISSALEGKKYLLLLDEVFSDINLRGLGVHDSHEHGKVVMASRSRVVCNDMDVDEEINVKRLSKSDAWKLFREIVGEAADHPRITPVARLVLKECGQLPQLIKAVGKTLKNVYNDSLWWNKLTRLRSPSGSRLQDMEEAFNAFKLVYDELTGDRKNCLLYGALFPEDHDIYQDYLMECWNAEQFILDVHSFRMARDEGHGILEDLINTSLLERCKNIDYVKMPMLFRGMALRIIHPNEANCSVLVRSGEGVTTHPPLEEWAGARRISLMCNELQTLPDRPECCTISTLLLQRNEALTTIPDSFFAYMCGLRVLDLYKTKIESLPFSISNLIDLRGLYLNDCRHIVELPLEIKELKNLEVLDIRGAGIRSLPTLIGELVGLRCLRVSFVEIVSNNNHVDTQQRIMIPPNMVVKLLRLEELTIDVDHREQSWNEIVNGIAKEVATLRTLTTLHFYFPTLSCFEDFITDRDASNNRSSCKSFRSFRLLVGSNGLRQANKLNISGNFNEGHLRYSGGEGSPAAILRRVLEQVITFELIGHRNIQSLSDFGMDGVRGLKIFIVRECNDMKSVVNGNTITGVAFPYLEQLHVINLPTLEHIWEGPLEFGSLAKLTILQLCGCSKLSNLLLVGMTKHLTKLQVLRVENCSQIENIIEADDQFVGLPELKILELLSLPALVSIYPNDTLSWPALEKLEITGCDRLINLPLSIEKASKLRRIECSDNWWRALAWQSDTIRDSLSSLCSFI